MQIAYDYSGVPTIRDFANSNARIRALTGPFASGKSSGSIVEIVRRGQMHPRSHDGIRHSRWAVVRNTYQELSLTTIKSIFQWLPPHYFGRYLESKHTYTIKAFEGCDIEIVFLALDRPQDIAKLLSLELTGGWINEVREVPWSIVEAMEGRIDRYPKRSEIPGGRYWSGIWMDTNPPDTDSKFYRYFEEKLWLPDFLKLQREGKFPAGMRPEEYAAIFKQPSGRSAKAENLQSLAPGYYDKLAIGKSQEWIKIYVDGQYGFVVEGKLVYPEYADKIHCQSVDPIAGLPIIRGWDFGLTPACTFSQLLPDGRWLTFDEMTSDNMSIDQFSDEVLEHCARAFRGGAKFEDWGDPAGEQRVQTDKKTCFQIMQAKDIQIEGSIQDPTLRQEAVRKMLRTLVGGEPQFILHPRCKMLRKGFMGGYHRRRMQTAGPERYTAEPEKNIYSHCFPAGMLIETPKGPRPIEMLSVGDMVLTPIGPRPVQATMNRDARGLLTLRTATGGELTCTPDHPVWANDGYRRADALRYGDVLQGASPWADRASIRFRNSMASAIIESLAAITKRRTPSAASTCTVPSGATTTEKSPMVSSSTISIATERTTTSITWTRWAQALMRLCTGPSAPQQIQKALACIWTPSGPRQANGIAPRKAAHGTWSTLFRWLLRSPLTSTPAFAAAANTRSSVVVGRSVIALRLASRLRAEKAVSMTNSASASSARARSSPTDIQRARHADSFVEAVWQPSAACTVYDLTVEDAHCFYANGLLVGNCHDAEQYAAVQYFGGALTQSYGSDDDDFGPQEDYAADADRDEQTGY